MSNFNFLQTFHKNHSKMELNGKEELEAKRRKDKSFQEVGESEDE